MVHVDQAISTCCSRLSAFGDEREWLELRNTFCKVPSDEDILTKSGLAILACMISGSQAGLGGRVSSISYLECNDNKSPGTLPFLCRAEATLTLVWPNRFFAC